MNQPKNLDVGLDSFCLHSSSITPQPFEYHYIQKEKEKKCIKQKLIIFKKLKLDIGYNFIVILTFKFTPFKQASNSQRMQLTVKVNNITG